MAVSKIAVIALVAIVACPILLGYAFNLTETTGTDYKPSGESVNVTPLIQNATGYTFAHGDIYQNNSSFNIGTAKIMPNYNGLSSFTKTSIQMRYYYYPTWSGTGVQPLDGIEKYYLAPLYDHNQYSINFTIYSGTTPLTTVNSFETIYYDHSNSTVYYTYNNGGFSAVSSYTNVNMDAISFTRTGMGNISTTVGIIYTDNSANTNYANIADGYYFARSANTRSYDIGLPEQTRKVIVSLDLDSITDPNYSVDMVFHYGLYRIRLEKTTIGSDVSWTASSYKNIPNVLMESYNLYYDPTKTDNTYQAVISASPSEYHPEAATPYYSADLSAELRYIGSWSQSIGELNYYQSYNFSPHNVSYTSEISINSVEFTLRNTSYRTPTVRIDDTLFRAFEYPIIENKTYTPSEFKANPHTTISESIIYGESITFGGNTYTVKNGSITLGSHQIPVKGLVLSSVPSDGGGYDNKIGNTVVSTTAQPSTITFNGQWNASITTIAQESYTYTKTEWHAGEFGWNGVDHNFLMVGLLTCLGVFIALGIYARKKGSGGLIPLMIVTGCAAAVFFIML